MDASTSYTMAPFNNSNLDDRFNQPLTDVPRRIYECCPEAKLIYVLRNPVNRTYSAYWHNVRAGHEPNDFRTALEKRSLYLRTSDYYHQLELYLKYFDKHNIKIVVFEELVKSPQSIYEECCEFIDIDKTETPVFEQKNKSYVYKGPLQQLNNRLSKIGGITPILKKISNSLPKSLKEKVGNSMVTKVPAISDADKAYLSDYFQPKVDKLETFIGRSIDVWK